MEGKVFRSWEEVDVEFFPNPTLEKLVEHIRSFDINLRCNFLHASEDNPNEGHLEIELGGEKKSFSDTDLIRGIIIPFYLIRGFKTIRSDNGFVYIKKDKEAYRISIFKSYDSYSVTIIRDHIMELSKN